MAAGRPVGRTEAHPALPGTGRRGRPRPRTGAPPRRAAPGSCPSAPRARRGSPAPPGRAAAAAPGPAAAGAGRAGRRGWRPPAPHQPLPRLGGVAQLPARMRQPSRLRLRRCGAGGAASKWNQSSAAGPRSAPRGSPQRRPPRRGRPRTGGAAGDPQVVVEPVGVRQRQHTGLQAGPSSPPLPRPPPAHSPNFATGLSLSSLARRT